MENQDENQNIGELPISIEKFATKKYSEKLSFWDENYFHYLLTEFPFDIDINSKEESRPYISIRPTNEAETISFNKWKYNHLVEEDEEYDPKKMIEIAKRKIQNNSLIKGWIEEELLVINRKMKSSIENETNIASYSYCSGVLSVAERDDSYFKGSFNDYMQELAPFADGVKDITYGVFLKEELSKLEKKAKADALFDIIEPFKQGLHDAYSKFIPKKYLNKTKVNDGENELTWEWHGHKNELTELIFALKASGRIRRKGDKDKPISQAEICEVFGSLFNMDLSDVTNTNRLAFTTHKKYDDKKYFTKKLSKYFIDELINYVEVRVKKQEE